MLCRLDAVRTWQPGASVTLEYGSSVHLLDAWSAAGDRGTDGKALTLRLGQHATARELE